MTARVLWLVKMREQYKEAFFVHCYAHRLNLVLSQFVSFLEHVETFFASLSGFGTSFSKSTKTAEALDAEIRKIFPPVAPTRWNYNSRLLETVQNLKTDIGNLFVTIIENGRDWDTETVSDLGLLREFDFNFFLAVFSATFPHSDRLFQILQPKSSDSVCCTEKLENFKLLLQRFRENFDPL